MKTFNVMSLSIRNNLISTEKIKDKNEKIKKKYRVNINVYFAGEMKCLHKQMSSLKYY